MATKTQDKQLALRTSEVTQLMSQAIDKNVPVETMEKLLAMRRELRAEQAREQYHAALAKFQAELPVIKKTKRVMNKDGKTERYRYAPLDSIVAQVKRLLDKHGFSHQEDASIEGKFVTARCVITHKEGHSETSAFSVPIDPDAYMNEAQKYASALTFTKRYAFCNALGILTGDADTDTVEIAADQPARPERHTRHTAYEEKTGEGDPKVSEDVAQLRAFLNNNKIPEAFLLRLLLDKKQIDGRVKTLEQIKPGIVLRCLHEQSKHALIQAWAQQRADEDQRSPFDASEPQIVTQGPVIEPDNDQQPAKGVRKPVDPDMNPHDLLEQEGYENWRTVPIHFGPNSKGKLLGKLPQKSLAWWIETYEPKPHRGRWNPKDLLLDAALCLASAELSGGTE